MPKMKFTATGDMLVQRRLPEGEYEGFEALRDFILQGDMRFFNLETTLHFYESYGSQYSGGSWLCMEPTVLEDVKSFGFNVATFANNHAMDFSYGGLEKTLDNLQKYNLPSAGVGRTMAEASAPTYLDCSSGRIALISAVSTFRPAALAGEQSRTMPGRPGVNGLRYTEIFRITKEQMRALKSIAGATFINGKDDMLRAEGYKPDMPDGIFDLRGILFKESNSTGKDSYVNEKDMLRIEKSIFEAQLQADYIIVSIHSHEIRHADNEVPDYFIEQFAHRCIDAGAHGVVGHGPHILRPIEIYKGRPIFYSLGDFVMQNENIQKAPADFFEGYDLSPNVTMHELFKKRSDNFTRGFQTKRSIFESVVPYWEMENGRLIKLILAPIELGFGLPRSRNGWPRIKTDAGILERLQHMSSSYGTQIDINKDGFGEVKLDPYRDC